MVLWKLGKKWGKSWTFLGKYGKLEEEESCLAKCYRIDPFEFGSGSRRNGEREIGNEFSLLIVVTFKIHGIQFQSWVIQDFFFCSWSTRLPRWNWLKAGKNLLCGRGWWNLRDARPECEWSDKRPLLNSFFHFKRISKFLLPSQRLRDSCYFNAFLQLTVRHGGKWNYFSCYPRCLYCNQLYEYSFFWVVLVPEFGKPELQNPP